MFSKAFCSSHECNIFSKLSETSNGSFLKVSYVVCVSSSLPFFYLIVLILHLLFIGLPQISRNLWLSDNDYESETKKLIGSSERVGGA